MNARVPSDTPILRFPSIPPLGSASAYAHAESALRYSDRAAHLAAYRSDRSGAAIVYSDRTGDRVLVPARRA